MGWATGPGSTDLAKPEYFAHIYWQTQESCLYYKYEAGKHDKFIHHYDVLNNHYTLKHTISGVDIACSYIYCVGDNAGRRNSDCDIQFIEEKIESTGTMKCIESKQYDIVKNFELGIGEIYNDFCQDQMEQWDPDEISMLAYDHRLCDVNEDGICDIADYDQIVASLGSCLGEEGYLPRADVDGYSDGCITEGDLDFLFPTEVYVEPTGKCNGIYQCYPTIQQGINAPGASVINVSGDSYNEDILIIQPKTITLMSGYNDTFTNTLGESTIGTLSIISGGLCIDGGELCVEGISLDGN